MTRSTLLSFTRSTGRPSLRRRSAGQSSSLISLIADAELLDMMFEALSSPVVPFAPFFGSGFPYKVTNPKQGALIIIWLLGYEKRLRVLVGLIVHLFMPRAMDLQASGSTSEISKP